MNNTESHPTPQIVWDEEHTVKLIKAYQAQNVLWNSDNRGFLHRSARYDAWRAMATVMQLNVRDVKRKMNSLIGVYRSQYRKGVANPRWWASHMSFMQPKMTKKLNNCENSENSENSMCNEHDDSEQEFLSSEPKKRSYASAFLEFQAEFETPKKEFTVNESTANEIPLDIPFEQSTAIGSHESDFEPKLEQEPESEPEPEPEPEPELEPPPEILSPVQPEATDDEDITLYVRYLECKLKKYPSHTRNTIQFEFNRILYEADLGLLDKASVAHFT